MKKSVNVMKTQMGDLVVFGKNETILVCLWNQDILQPLTATTVVNKEVHSFLYEDIEDEHPVSVKHRTAGQDVLEFLLSCHPEMEKEILDLFKKK